MAEIRMIVVCDMCGEKLKVTVLEPHSISGGFNLNAKVESRCRCYTEAIEEARTTAVDNILGAVRDMAKGGKK